MNKAIEEAAREFMETAPIEAVSPYYEEDMIEMFRGGTAHLLSLPLSQRLTDEERERVRDAYNEAVEIRKNADPMGSRFAFWDARKELLESIFGKEFFREGEV